MSLLKEKKDMLNAYKQVYLNEAVNKPVKPTGNVAGAKKTSQPSVGAAVPFSGNKVQQQAVRQEPASNEPTIEALPPSADTAEEIVAQAEPKIDSINQQDAVKKQYDLDDLLQYSSGESDIAAYGDTDLPEWGFKDLEPLVSRSYILKEPILIYGDPGIGKSSTVEYFAEHVAAPSRERIYRNWSECSIEEKSEIIRNPEKYFVLIIELVNKLEPSDFMGVPELNSDRPYLETKQLKWIYLMSRPGADGILFLDEINLGEPQILKSLYEVVLDKSAAGTKFSKDFAIMAAGNIAGEFTQNVDPLPSALRDRFNGGVLIAKPEEWCDFAERAGVDKRIIAFIKADPKNNFYTKPGGDSDPFVTPRSLTKLSKQLKFIYKQYGEYLEKGQNPPMPLPRAIALAAGKLGVKWANRFTLFLKHIRAFDLKKITKDIDNINKKEQSELMALTVFLSSKVKFAAQKEYAENKPVKNSPTGYTVTNPESFEVLEALAIVFVKLAKDPCATLFSFLKRDLTPEEFGTVLEFLFRGNYNDKIKKEVATKLPKMAKITMGEV
jgi:MoxR-like ATPase